MKKTELLKMRIDDGCIYLGRIGREVYVFDEKGEAVDTSKLPVYPRKFIKTKAGSIPEIKGELEFGEIEEVETVDETVDEEVAGTSDDTTDSTEGDDQDQGDDTTDSTETNDDETLTEDESTKDEGETLTEEEVEEEAEEEVETEEEVKTEEVKTEEVKTEEAPLPDNLKELKVIAEELKVKAEEITGQTIKVEISSLRAKKDVIEKIGKLRELIAKNTK